MTDSEEQELDVREVIEQLEDDFPDAEFVFVDYTSERDADIKTKRDREEEKQYIGFESFQNVKEAIVAITNKLV